MKIASPNNVIARVTKNMTPKPDRSAILPKKNAQLAMPRLYDPLK
jgi:hypothetical protein